MSIHYALDFGTTNSVLTSDRNGGVEVVTLPDVSADRARTPVVPSAVCFTASGSPHLIGQSAISQNVLGRLPNFAQGFKRKLGRESHRAVARLDEKAFSARQAAVAFFDGLRAAVRHDIHPRHGGLRGWWDDLQDRRHPLLADLTLTTPVDADELYRREITALGLRLGARTLRLLDEPVAAALGYGVNIGRELVVLVVDWGGGTLDISIVRTGPETLVRGRAEVLAKSAVPIGGDDVDTWIAGQFLVPLSDFVTEWEVDAAQEAARVKETASIEGDAMFRFRSLPARRFTRDDLRGVLAEHGAYAALGRALAEALEQLRLRHGLGPGAINEALLVGGSSLLPGVDERVRAALPTARVSEWNVFAAVAEGACVYARGAHVADQIYHDYALRMTDDTTRSVYYELIFPAGTCYPTAGASIQRVYIPDPGSPNEIVFEVCEIARLGREPVSWMEEANGRRTWRPTAPADHARALVINEGQTILRLPASRNNGRRLHVTYNLDRERYLRWTVLDGRNILRDNEVLGRLR